MRDIDATGSDDLPSAREIIAETDPHLTIRTPVAVYYGYAAIWLRIEPECLAMLRLLLLIAMPFIVDAAVAYALAATPDDRPVQASMVFFDWDQSDLSPHARATVAEAGSGASGGRIVRIVLQAADGMGGGTAYSAALSQARWRSVMAELAQDGVSPGQVARSGLGMLTIRPRGMALATPTMLH